MRKLLTILLAGMMMVTAGWPSVAEARPHGRPPMHRGGPTVVYRGHGGGHGGWHTAGTLMAGVLIGSVLQSACYAAPTRREVVYVQQQPVVYQPAPVVQYAPPPVVVVRQESVTETVWVLNSNGSQTPVELRRADGGRYIGPKGEYYTQFPTNEQLRQLYGM
ncbi:MAG: hypothetical protein PHR35_01725 [Kiritimatiellae bacterium]|nr:hypothetical protein [Kiritimatiellia bacterium]